VRAFNAIGAARLPAIAQDKARRVGMPIAGDDAAAIEIGSRLVRDAGLEPVLVGRLAMGKYLMPGTALAGENAPDKVREIAATLK
jgi:predicted dinucleotide-binding enzyme